MSAFPFLFLLGLGLFGAHHLVATGFESLIFTAFTTSRLPVESYLHFLSQLWLMKVQFRYALLLEDAYLTILFTNSANCCPHLLPSLLEQTLLMVRNVDFMSTSSFSNNCKVCNFPGGLTIWECTWDLLHHLADMNVTLKNKK